MVKEQTSEIFRKFSETFDFWRFTGNWCNMMSSAKISNLWDYGILSSYGILATGL